MTKRISVVIPVFNEQASLTELLTQVDQIFQKELKDFTLEIVLVNDGSTDSSLEVMKKLAKESGHIRIISFRSNLGKAAALNQGFRKASGDIIVTMDGDLQDGPENIPLLIEKLEAGSDLVVGWRKLRQDNFGKVLTSGIFNFFVGSIGGVKIHDFNCGLKAMKKEVTKEINLYGELHRFIPVLAFQRGYKVSEVPIIHHQRKYGLSKYTWGKLPQGFFDFLTIMFLNKFGQRPFHLFGLLGSLCLLIGISLGTYLSVLHFMGQSIIGRPLLVFVVLLILAGLQLVCIGLMATMISDKSTSKRELPIDYESE